MTTEEVIAMTHERVLVGVDDSADARAALRWAAHEAVLRDAQLYVLHTYRNPIGTTPMLLAGPIIDFEAPEREAKSLVEDVVDGELGAMRPVPDVVNQRVVDGPPGEMLVEAAHHADLLVVGSRGRGAARSAVLGSVSSHCVRHAPCPVVVVPRSRKHPKE